MRVLIDYRPALRERTGVGEVAHQMARALATTPAPAGEPLTVALWTSSWRDRPSRDALAEIPGAEVVDRRIPVRLLNWMWHRLEWPPIEWLAGSADVAHSLHPLLLPARRAAQVVTVHDLFFLRQPEKTWAEIRRDYPVLVRNHVRRADAVVTPSRHTAVLVARELGVDLDRITVCPWGPPQWRRLGTPRPLPRDGYILFVGTLEPRKNVSGLLDAYRLLVERHPEAPRLLLAGRPTAEGHSGLDLLTHPSLVGRVDQRGYVPAGDREVLYGGARLLVLPSYDEGFGLPVLEAMSAGVPVIVSNRGALPEVAGTAAAAQIEPDDHEGLADAMWRVVSEPAWADDLAARGRQRASEFSWSRTAAALRTVYGRACARRRERGR